jgi:hypothetical protein
MATGRTVIRFLRAYYDGYDVSGFARSVGPLENTFAEVDVTGIVDPLTGALPGHVQNNVGTLAANFDNTAISGILAVGDAGKGAPHTLLIPIGIRAAPAIGDPAFMGRFLQKDFTGAVDAAGGVVVSMPFSGWSAPDEIQYANPWGTLTHAMTAETAVNSGNAGVDGGAQTLFGGYAVFQLLAYTGGTGPVLKVQHSVDQLNADYSDLISSGVLTPAPAAAVVALALGTTVKEFTRWQVVLNGATSVTFAIGFVRSLGA